MGVEWAKWTGQRVREVSTSLISSLSLPVNHWDRKGPAKAERKVSGEPSGLRLRTGAEWKETEEEEEGRGGGNHVGGKEGEREPGGRE